VDITPIDRNKRKATDTLYLQIVERIRQWIGTGNLKDGDLLPSERDFAQMLGVSRVPVREALKVLEFLGAVQHIRGKGVYVRKIGIGHVLSHIDFLMADSTQLLTELFEARQGLECQAARLAAERCTEKDFLLIESEIMEMEKVIILGGDVEDASVRFHTAIITASHNALLMRINEMFMDLLRFSRRRSLQKPSRYADVLRDHRFILEKIRQHDGAGAAKALCDHLEVAKTMVFASESSEAKGKFI